MILFTYVVYSSVNFILASPLNPENLSHCFVISSLSSHGKNPLYDTCYKKYYELLMLL